MFSSFHGRLRPFHPGLNPAVGKASEAETGSPSQVQALSPADPSRMYFRAAHFLHSGRFVSFLARFYLQPADQEREEEGITSDGWSGELMNGAAGRKICG